MSEQPDSAEATRAVTGAQAPVEPPADPGADDEAAHAPVVDPGAPAADDDAPEAGSEPRTDEQSAARAPAEPDWKDLALRKAAELENVRKQTAQRVQKATRDGMRRVASELLPALDDFERALAHAEAVEGDHEHHLTAGIRLVQQQMLSALQRAGIESFSPKGELFDPHRHEAMAQQPADGVAAGTVIEVYQAGYRLGEDVLRPARVVVAG